MKAPPEYIIIKKQEHTEQRILKVPRLKDQVTSQDRPIRITPDISMETLKARRAKMDDLQTLRGHRSQPR